MLWTQALGAERGGLSARPHCGRRRRQRAGPERPFTFAAATLGAERAARGATLAPGLNLGPKMAGTGKKGARFPVPSAPPAGAGRQPRAAPPVPGSPRGGPPNPHRQRRLHRSKEAPALSGGEGKRAVGGCRSHASGVCSAWARGRGKREEALATPAPRCRVGRRLPRAPGASRALAHPSCALLGGRRALQADGGDAGDPDPRSAAGAGGAHGGRGAAEREAAGRLLLPGRKRKPVWFGQVVARRAWRLSGPPRLPAAGSSESPTPHPPPSPGRSPSGLSSPRPSSSGSWAGPCASRPQR